MESALDELPFGAGQELNGPEGAERASFQPVKQLRGEPTTCQPRNSLRKKQGTCWNKQLKDDH